jgi:hypothetical protein
MVGHDPMGRKRSAVVRLITGVVMLIRKFLVVSSAARFI